MKLVQVQFKEGGTRYTYEAPDSTQVGDTVMFYSWLLGGEQSATVAAVGSDYAGPVKRVRLVETA
jgi:hypothetical protein